jgi:DNA polymerase III subunit gamma/tau
MNNYQVFARKYRPKTFSEVIGQEAIVTTLKNAIHLQRLAHAYLFSGSRGTGKTTLARVFAKALNCLQPTVEREPCNQCTSCKEISSGHSLDVLEVDGASHRGIDDVRQINETVGYSTSTGGYKIYIIDEVHMLTKEAFNALLKTLEEPPPRVLFFFATTEPHKVPATILSRCQRFNLNRIPLDKIMAKLQAICEEMHVKIEDEALRMISQRAEGGLRDAESLLDQILSFHEGDVTTERISAILGVMPRDAFFALDKAGKEGNLAMAFDISHQIFAQGKDILHFVEDLAEHFRTLLLMKLGGPQAPYLQLSSSDSIQYEISSKIYSQEQCLNLLNYLLEAQNQIRFNPSPRLALEGILLHILRSHQQIPVEFLIRRLNELEQVLTKGTAPKPSPQQPPQIPPQTPPLTPPTPPPAFPPSINEDPRPTPADLGLREKKKSSSERPAPIQSAETISSQSNRALSPEEKRRYDTLLQFAAVELEGTIQKTTNLF